jgi:uncharacterized protein
VLSALGFVATVAIVLGLIHLYLWKRLVRDTTRPGRWRRAGGLVALALAGLVPATMVAARAGFDWPAWPGYLWLALMFYLLVALVALELPMLAARLALRRRTSADNPVGVPAPVGVTAPAEVPAPALVGAGATAEPPASGAVPGPIDHDPGRRLLLARGAAIFAGLTATAVTGYGVTEALSPPRLRRVQIPLAKLPRDMDGLRIAAVADIHLGPLAGRRHTERVVAAINRLDADLVAVVGDLVDGTVAELGAAAAPLRDLRARHGSYFVTGNHEYYYGVEEWVAEVDRLGLRVLQNERLEIRARGGVLDLAGVDDPTATEIGPSGGPDFERALGGRDPTRPVVLLAHQPVQVREASRYGVDLQLSGHTHGGQMVPFNYLVGLQQPVVSGLATVDGTNVFVTTGAGFWGPPVRVGVPPEVTLVELRSGA